MSDSTFSTFNLIDYRRVRRVFGFEDAAQRICADFETRFKHYLQMAEEALDNN